MKPTWASSWSCWRKGASIDEELTALIDLLFIDQELILIYFITMWAKCVCPINKPILYHEIVQKIFIFCVFHGYHRLSYLSVHLRIYLFVNGGCGVDIFLPFKAMLNTQQKSQQSPFKKYGLGRKFKDIFSQRLIQQMDLNRFFTRPGDAGVVLQTPL